MFDGKPPSYRWVNTNYFYDHGFNTYVKLPKGNTYSDCADFDLVDWNGLLVHFCCFFWVYKCNPSQGRCQVFHQGRVDPSLRCQMVA
jgi:hypothetical protein